MFITYSQPEPRILPTLDRRVGGTEPSGRLREPSSITHVALPSGDSGVTQAAL